MLTVSHSMRRRDTHQVFQIVGLVLCALLMLGLLALGSWGLVEVVRLLRDYSAAWP